MATTKATKPAIPNEEIPSTPEIMGAATENETVLPEEFLDDSDFREMDGITSDNGADSEVSYSGSAVGLKEYCDDTDIEFAEDKKGMDEDDAAFTPAESDFEDLDPVSTITEEAVDEPAEAPAKTKKPRTTKKKPAEKPADRRVYLAEKDAAREKREANLRASQRAEIDWSALNSARHRQSILAGTIVGVENRGNPNAENPRNRYLICCVVLVGNRSKVLIPFESMFISNPIDIPSGEMETTDGARRYAHRQRQMAEKMYGVEIPFVITKMGILKKNHTTELDNEYIIIGSRAAALKRISHKYYGENDAGSIVKEGSSYKATILSVSAHGVLVNVAGVDTRIPQYHLTYRYIEDLQTEFKAGNTINVVVSAIKRSDKGVSIEANGLFAELAEAKERMTMLPIGTNVLGVITGVWMGDGDRVRIRAYIRGYNLPANIAYMAPGDFTRQVKVGDEVRMVVTGYKPSGYIIASCKGLHGAAGLLYHA